MKKYISKNVIYDTELDILYVRISKRKIHKTKKINDNINIDVDEKGNLVGISYLKIYELIKRKEIC